MLSNDNSIKAMLQFVNGQYRCVAFMHLSVEKWGKLMYYLAMVESKPGTIYKEQIDKILEARGFSSYAALAKEAGLNRSTLTRLFNDESRGGGNAKTLSRLATALHTSVEYIEGKTDDARRSDAEQLPEFAVEIIETMKHLDRTQRHELMIIARALAANAAESAQLRQEEFVAMAMDIADEMNPDEARRWRAVLTAIEEKAKQSRQLPGPSERPTSPQPAHRRAFLLLFCNGEN